MSGFYQELGRNIRDARLGEGMTQAQLAQRLGMTTTCLSYYETGRRRPSIRTLAMISEVLYASLDFLIPDVDFEPLVDPGQSDIYELIGE